MNEKNKGQGLATILVLAAGIMWGCIGIFVRQLNARGFSAPQITTIRCLENAALILVLILITDRTKLKIERKDLKWFLLNGIGSVFIFNTAYQASISMTSMSTAVVLLYTSPAFVMLFSVLFFKERFTGKKAFSLLLCIGGSALVSRITDGFSGSAMGIGLGLLSGVGYALYSIYSTIILRKYHTFTNIFYTFGIAGLMGLCFAKPLELFELLTASPSNLAWASSSALVTGFLAYVCYTLALTRIRASRAAILATIEPVTAILLGVFLYQEKIGLAGFVGIVMVLSAVFMQNLGGEE